jgi:hypothetical protein
MSPYQRKGRPGIISGDNQLGNGIANSIKTSFKDKSSCPKTSIFEQIPIKTGLGENRGFHVFAHFIAQIQR